MKQITALIALTFSLLLDAQFTNASGGAGLSNLTAPQIKALNEGTPILVDGKVQPGGWPDGTLFQYFRGLTPEQVNALIFTESLKSQYSSEVLKKTEFVLPNPSAHQVEGRYHNDFPWIGKSTNRFLITVLKTGSSIHATYVGLQVTAAKSMRMETQLIPYADGTLSIDFTTMVAKGMITWPGILGKAISSAKKGAIETSIRQRDVFEKLATENPDFIQERIEAVNTLLGY